MTLTPTAEFNRYDKDVLKRREAMATRLKYGKGQDKALEAVSMTKALGIDFPKGLAPVPDISISAPSPTSSLPQADVIAMMDTEAEWQAMADVLTPGIETDQWHPYAKNFKEKFLPQIGPRGPSRESKCLGQYCVVKLNGLKVLVYKTDLHLSEDAKKLPDGSYSLPIKEMLVQMIGDASPRLFLTTGTSGGVYCSMNLGDVAVTRAAQFHCMDHFGKAPFNNQLFKSDWALPTGYFPQAEQLMHSFAGHLTGKSIPKGSPPNSKCSCSSPSSTYPTQIYHDGSGGIPQFHPILTTDFFEFGTSTNNLDQLGMAVEMDDACLGLACSELSAPPHWASVRNMSDPAINGRLGEKIQENCAEYYYTKFGYWTTVMSALTTWGIIAGL